MTEFITFENKSSKETNETKNIEQIMLLGKELGLEKNSQICDLVEERFGKPLIDMSKEEQEDVITEFRYLTFAKEIESKKSVH